MKKYFVYTFLSAFILFVAVMTPVISARAETTTPKQANLYFFKSDGCPHCAKEKLFLEDLANKYPQLTINEYEISKNKDNRDLLIEVGKTLKTDVSGVPFTVVGEKYFTGWYSAQTTGQAIEEAVQCALDTGCRDIVAEILSKKNTCPDGGDACKDESSTTSSGTIAVPILGNVETKNVSLPLLATVLGIVDGFNPCAMWALIFLISLLLGMKNRKRMWLLGSAFIVASAAVYFLFMAAWLNLILFLGIVLWIRILIGLVALGSGGYNFREYLINKNPTCKVSGGKKKQRVFEKLKLFTQTQKFWLALGGVIVLAAVVNLVELVCSAGLPVVFTQVLTLSNLPAWQYYFYILVYIFFFMLDDLIVFFVAMTTLRLTGASTKYASIARLIGAIIMIVIGLLLLFKPQWLMFG